MITVQSTLVLEPYVVAEVQFVQGIAWVQLRDGFGSRWLIRCPSEIAADRIAHAFNVSSAELPTPAPRLGNS
ncbi:MAG: hypothetical protein AB7G35_15085 [Hyphomicrobiaceae bacterium]